MKEVVSEEIAQQGEAAGATASGQWPLVMVFVALAVLAATIAAVAFELGDLVTAWQLWFAGEETKDIELWCCSIFWLGRLAKIASLISLIALAIEIIGEDRIRDFVRAAAITPIWVVAINAKFVTRQLQREAGIGTEDKDHWGRPFEPRTLGDKIWDILTLKFIPDILLELPLLLLAILPKIGVAGTAFIFARILWPVVLILLPLIIVLWLVSLPFQGLFWVLRNPHRGMWTKVFTAYVLFITFLVDLLAS